MSGATGSKFWQGQGQGLTIMDRRKCKILARECQVLNSHGLNGQELAKHFKFEVHQSVLYTSPNVALYWFTLEELRRAPWLAPLTKVSKVWTGGCPYQSAMHCLTHTRTWHYRRCLGDMRSWEVQTWLKVSVGRAWLTGTK